MVKPGTPRWVNEPSAHRREGTSLIVTTGRETDFWNNTFYGFRHTNGHVLAHEVTGDFSLLVTFSAAYRDLYDQAGVMLRVDDNNWLKCGVEYADGLKNFSTVVTRNDQSDWSVTTLRGRLDAPVTLRLTRHAEALRVQVRTSSGWRFVRLAYLKMPETVSVGPMCCSPVGGGLEVTFHRIAFSEPISRELHE